MIYNARAQPLFSSCNLLFGGFLISVAVVVWLSSLLKVVSSLIVVMTSSQESSLTIRLRDSDIVYRDDTLCTPEFFLFDSDRPYPPWINFLIIWRFITTFYRHCTSTYLYKLLRLDSFLNLR